VIPIFTARFGKLQFWDFQVQEEQGIRGRTSERVSRKGRALVRHSCHNGKKTRRAKWKVLAIMAPMGLGSYCTLRLLFSRVTVLPPRVTVLPQV
jgi:hypothetical protein